MTDFGIILVFWRNLTWLGKLVLGPVMVPLLVLALLVLRVFVVVQAGHYWLCRRIPFGRVSLDLYGLFFRE